MSKENFLVLGAPRWPASMTRIGLWAIGVGLVGVAIAGPMSRFGITNFRIALLLLAAGLLVLVVGALLAIVGFMVALAKGSRVPKGSTAVAVVAALAMLGYLLTWLRAGMGVPPIHEISTDLAAPPPFVAVKAIRDVTPG